MHHTRFHGTELGGAVRPSRVKMVITIDNTRGHPMMTSSEVGPMSSQRAGADAPGRSGLFRLSFVHGGFGRRVQRG